MITEIGKQEPNVPVEHNSRQLRKILVTVCIALMAVIASVSGLNVAQPDLAIEFNASQSTVLWMINIYAISLAALLLPLGALGDRLGRRPVLITGLIIFGIANVAAGISTSSEMILVSRLLSGIGAAMIMPITLAVITSTFPAEERSKAIGIWTAVAGGGGIIGMYLSAVLVDYANWRWLFLLPVVLVIVSLVMALRFIPNSIEKATHRFDIGGSILSIIGIIGIVFALHEAPSLGWSELSVLICLVVGLLSILGFVLWELRQKAPLLNLRFFRKRGLSSGSVSLTVIFGVQAGIFVLLFPFFQAALGWSGLRATFGMMPMAILMMLASGLSPKLSARIGNRYTMAVGIILFAVGLILLATLVSIDGGYFSVLPGMLAMGLGMGISMTPSTEAITSALPSEHQGVASALNDLTRELGTALGVALLGALVTAGYSNAIDNRLHELPPNIVAVAREGIANALDIAPKAGSQSNMLILAAKESFVEGWQQAMWIGAIVMAVLFVYVLIWGAKSNEASIVISDKK
ncbi:EmrB/QacA subfamily drug resistance transporter [Tenacibaculum adriaticum]|uniref:EmrB/QacA subfamily drug resistance transporter n=1 Tax=Tenacibaculum adriaticum TaxID=413713 RepID=A0A5S5DWQ5_9FLAO|nr:MFS transporter [Tenacibaculum adriaticum]TYQ00165.1 EmrB/QacA subfamily drug resistance transporter [Tenacibaculum adriaticum]